jgi:hypothetical protein
MPFSSKISSISLSLTSNGWLAIQSSSSDTLSFSSFARSLLDRRGDSGAFSGLSARGGLLRRFGVAGSAWTLLKTSGHGFFAALTFPLDSDFTSERACRPPWRRKSFELERWDCMLNAVDVWLLL